MLIKRKRGDSMKKKKRPHEQMVADILFDMEEASSVNDFTGMLPTPPQSDYERESYQDILDYTPEPVKKDCLY